MLHNEAAVWEKSPWGDVGLAIEAHASTTPFSGHEAIKLKVEYKGSAQYEVTVSDFQDYIKGRIMGQATLVERVKLGSAIGVQLELLEKLSEVWTLIRDNGLEPPAPTLPAKYMPNQLAESELWYERDVHVERDRLSRHADRSYHLPQNVYGSSSDGAPSESNVPTSASVVDRHPESFVSPVGMGQVAQAPAPMYRYTGASKQNSGSHSPTGIPTPERIRVIPSQEEYSEPHVVRIGGGSSPALPQIVRVTAPRPVAANSVPQVIHIGRSDQLAGPEIIRVAVPRS